MQKTGSNHTMYAFSHAPLIYQYEGLLQHSDKLCLCQLKFTTIVTPWTLIDPFTVSWTVNDFIYIFTVVSELFKALKVDFFLYPKFEKTSFMKVVEDVKRSSWTHDTLESEFI